MACGVVWQNVVNSATHNTANSAWQVLADKTSKAKMGQCLGGGLLSLSLSLLALVANLWVKFKGLFYSFYRSFISFYCRFCSFYRNFISSCRKFFLFIRSFLSSFCSCFSFYHSFNSSFCLQKAFFRIFCLFEIFKRFVFGLLRPFCHFEPLQKGDPTGCKAQAAAKKSTKIKRKLAIFRYFACAQYDKNYDTKSVWYDKFRLSPKIFETNEKFKKFKKFKEFANFLLEVQKRHYVS